jgi:hypothetical protein
MKLDFGLKFLGRINLSTPGTGNSPVPLVDKLKGGNEIK